MAESARFEIYPEFFSRAPYDKRKPLPTGRYRWRFCVGDMPVCSSDQSFAGRELASDDIHQFMDTIDAAECGIHPDIIDLDEAP